MRKKSDYTHHKKEKEKPLYLEGNLIHIGKKNLNGRVYTEEISVELVQQFNKRKEKGDDVMGSLGYSSTDNYEVDLNHISHKVEKIEIDKDNNSLKGKIKLLDTPSGRKVKKIVEESIKNNKPIGMSCRPRLIGQVNIETKQIENFKILSIDLIPTQDDSFSNIYPNDFIKPSSEG
ncbi:MAG: hypothetical protein ACOC1K_01390 [Nanoarchaeota archaeon]